jgi:hypothetical protein
MKMLMVLAPVVAMFISQGAMAGAAAASIECVSASGKTKVTAQFPGDFEESGFIFSIEGRSDAYADEGLLAARKMNDDRIYDEYKYAKLSKITSVDKLLSKKTLSLGVGSVTDDQAWISLEAISSTVKMKKTMNGSTGVFSATVQGLDPRTGGGSPSITVKCNYRYEI